MKLSFSAVYIFTALVALTSAAPVPIPAAQCKRIDIRRNIADLTTAQRDTFFSAIQKLKDTPDPNASDASIYDKYVKIHTDYVDQGHGNAQFIPWHRVFIRQFELELQSVEPSVVLPYWDWSISSQAPERSIVFTNDYLGGNGDSGSGCVTSGRFANWQTRYPSKGCLQRRFDGGNKIGAFTAPELLNRMIYETNSYADFESQLEYGIHGRVHVGVGGTMGQMWSTSDPLFYLHHANVDRLWSMYQGRGEKQAIEYNGQGPSNRAVSLDDVLLPFNKTVREAIDMVNNLCYSYTQQEIPTPGDQSTPTPSVIVVVPTVTPTILQSSTPTPATSTPVTTTTPATTPTATQVQEPEITPVTTPLPETTPIVTSTVPDQIPETTTVTETTTTATPIPETTTVTETTTTATPIPETTTVTETTTTATPIPETTTVTETTTTATPIPETTTVTETTTSATPIPETTTVTETTTTATQIPETTTVTEAPTTPTPGIPESTRVTGTMPIVSATPVATTQPTNTSQPPHSSGTVDAYDRSNMGKIRMPARIPEAWLIMNRLSLDKYAAHEATLLQLVKQYNSRSVSSAASLQFYKDVPTCDVISDKVFQAYGVPVPNKKILHLTAPIGKVRYLSADGVTGSDGGSHVNPRNLPVADLTASDGSTNPVGSNPTTSSATTLAPAIPLAGLIAAAVLFHW